MNLPRSAGATTSAIYVKAVGTVPPTPTPAMHRNNAKVPGLPCRHRRGTKHQNRQQGDDRVSHPGRGGATCKGRRCVPIGLG